MIKCTCVASIVDSRAASVRLHMIAPVGRVWFCARKHQLPSELLLLAAVVAQAVVDARRGDKTAVDWLKLQGF